LLKEVQNRYIPNPLQTFENYKKQLSLKIRKNFIDEFHALRDGYTFIGNYSDQLKEKLSPSLEVKKILRDLVQVDALLKAGKTFQEIIGCSNEDLVEIYSLAERLFNEKKYYESGAIFKLLCLVQPLCHRFWIGAGDALEADERNREALASYYGGLFSHPYSFDLYLRICNALCKCGENEKAHLVIKEALTMLEQSERESPLAAELSTLRDKLNTLKNSIPLQK
jgi:hypothetical protein